MNKVILPLVVSLMVPAYATQPQIDDTKVNAATHELGECMRKVAQDGRPISDADKAAFKKALDNFYKEMKNYYELDKKAHKSAFKTIGHGLGSYLTRPSYPMYPSYGTGFGAPTMGTITTPSGIYPYAQMGLGNQFTTFPMGLPH